MKVRIWEDHWLPYGPPINFRQEDVEEQHVVMVAAFFSRIMEGGIFLLLDGLYVLLQLLEFWLSPSAIRMPLIVFFGWVLQIMFTQYKQVMSCSNSWQGRIVHLHHMMWDLNQFSGQGFGKHPTYQE